MNNPLKVILILSGCLILTSCQSANHSDANPEPTATINEDELQGAHISFNDQEMEIEIMEMEILPDGSTMGATGSDNETMIVSFDEATVFEIHELSATGETNGEIRQGTAQDLSLSRSVAVSGAQQNAEFIATLVKIWVFVD